MGAAASVPGASAAFARSRICTRFGCGVAATVVAAVAAVAAGATVAVARGVSGFVGLNDIGSAVRTDAETEPRLFVGNTGSVLAARDAVIRASNSFFPVVVAGFVGRNGVRSAVLAARDAAIRASNSFFWATFASSVSGRGVRFFRVLIVPTVLLDTDESFDGGPLL